MNIRWSLLVVIALLSGCSDDDSDSDTSADGGATDGGAMRDASAAGSSPADRADSGRGMHHGDAAMPDASSEHDSGSPEQVHGTMLPSCPAVQGLFNPVYSRIDGTCGAIANPTPVPFDGGLHGVNTIMQNTGTALITTDIVLKGCDLHMTQKVTNREGMLQTQIDAPELSIESATRITGRVSLTRFDATSTVACQGNYDAVFSKTSALGAAH